MTTINENIINRKSYRSFKNQVVEDDDILALIEAARWSPSSVNGQPWRYLIAKQTDKNFNRIIETMYPANQEWAKNAPLLMVSVTQSFVEKEDRYRRISWMDTGGANANLTIQAISMGLFVHQIGGFDERKMKVNFDFDDSVDCVCILAVGYHGDGSDLTSPTFIEREKAERVRKAVNELILKQ
jgi:nitroreductase